MNYGRKISGGRYHKQKKLRLHENKNKERKVTLGETKRKVVKVRGGNLKVILLKADTANIMVDGKAKKAEIKNISETAQNPFLARQNIIMKGAVIDTSLGKARVTNRPSQEGLVNAVLVKEEKKH